MPPFVPEIAARAKISKELLGQASLMHCCLHVSPSRIEIALFDASSGQVAWIDAFDLETTRHDSWDDVLSFISERNWFEKVYRKCTLTFDTGEYTLVPAAFFEAGREAHLLQFHTGKNHTSADVLALSEYGAHMVFEIPDAIRALSAHFPNIRIFPAAWILARYAWTQVQAHETAIVIWQSLATMDMAVIKDRKLLLLRNDAIRSPEDMLYHAANASLMLGIDFENTPVCIFPLKDGEATQHLFEGYCKELKTLRNGDVSMITKMHVACV